MKYTITIEITTINDEPFTQDIKDHLQGILESCDLPLRDAIDPFETDDGTEIEFDVDVLEVR